ncbi:hypothetical protein D1872_352540 [compost metagenome]
MPGKPGAKGSDQMYIPAANTFLFPYAPDSAIEETEDDKHGAATDEGFRQRERTFRQEG